jgi:nucleoside phosphorylase
MMTAGIIGAVEDDQSVLEELTRKLDEEVKDPEAVKEAMAPHFHEIIRRLVEKVSAATGNSIEMVYDQVVGFLLTQVGKVVQGRTIGSLLGQVSKATDEPVAEVWQAVALDMSRDTEA